MLSQKYLNDFKINVPLKINIKRQSFSKALSFYVNLIVYKNSFVF